MSFDPIELKAALQSIPWFQEMDQSNYDQMYRIARIREVEAGEKLFREGDKEDFLYIVLEGRIAVEIFIPSRGRIRIFTAEPTDVVGWSSATPVVRQRTASATAVLPSRLVYFDAVELRTLCENDNHLGYVVMRRLANVVASRLLITRLQLVDMFAHPELEARHD